MFFLFFLAWAKIISPERENCRLSENSPKSTHDFRLSETTLTWAKTLQRAPYFVYDKLAQASCVLLRRDLQSELFCKVRLSEIFSLKRGYLKIISQLN